LVSNVQREKSKSMASSRVLQDLDQRWESLFDFSVEELLEDGFLRFGDDDGSEIRACCVQQKEGLRSIVL
jgi:hypothetical protein